MLQMGMVMQVTMEKFIKLVMVKMIPGLEGHLFRTIPRYFEQQLKMNIIGGLRQKMYIPEKDGNDLRPLTMFSRIPIHWTLQHLIPVWKQKKSKPILYFRETRILKNYSIRTVFIRQKPGTMLIYYLIRDREKFVPKRVDMTPVYSNIR